ncbi:hypothetical protein [uncultured Methanobrevibacter sp.]|uniref:hypothetical protein n=1 Tax=uncultured Methanobrevibacter sp. TaxID=253161 RepID=UPI00345B09B0
MCTIINCSFENGWAEKKGGAIYSTGELRIYNSTFLKNSVEDDWRSRVCRRQFDS